MYMHQKPKKVATIIRERIMEVKVATKINIGSKYEDMQDSRLMDNILPISNLPLPQLFSN